MKTTFKHIVFFITLGLIFGSCEEEYIIDTSDFESKLVVNSVFTHNVPWSVSVTHSVNRLDNQQEISSVDNAKVEIYDQNGDHLYNLSLNEDGKYSYEQEGPSYGRCYSIIVSASSYKSVYAKDQVPTEGELTINKRNILDENGEIIDTEITFFIGKADKETYLVWELYDENEIGENGIPEKDRELTNSWLSQLTKNPKSIISSNKTKVGKTLDGNMTTTLGTLLNIDKGGRSGPSGGPIDGNGGANSETDGLDVEDFSSLFSGGSGEGDDTDEANEEGGETEEKPKYELRVMTISKDLHTYFKSVEEYYKFNPNSTLIPPSRVHSNITNGLGVFGGYHEQVITF